MQNDRRPPDPDRISDRGSRACAGPKGIYAHVVWGGQTDEEHAGGLRAET